MPWIEHLRLTSWEVVRKNWPRRDWFNYRLGMRWDTLFLIGYKTPISKKNKWNNKVLITKDIVQTTSNSWRAQIQIYCIFGRLSASWRCRSFQGLVCSPIKALRELGSNRRKTGWSLSAVSVGFLREFVFSTRGPRWVNPWCASCCRQTHCWVATLILDNRWMHLSEKLFPRWEIHVNVS